MIIDNPAPFFAINFLCFVLAGLIFRNSGFYRELLGKVEADHSNMIDGLRGWLALGVFFTHVTIMHSYFVAGKLEVPAGTFYDMTGQVAVSLFFMITGFLFWSRVLRSDGVLNVETFYVSRLRRIVPMYLASVAMSLVVVAALSGFSLKVSPYELLRELRAWFSFGFMYAGDINGIKDAHHINAVYWTLAFEWGFYVALPLLAILARGTGAFLVFSIAFLYCLQTPVTLNFIAGALAAVMVERKLIGDRAKPWIYAPLPIAALAAVFTFPTAYAVSPVVLMFVFFLFVVGGNSLIGLLASRPARLLGTISYSIYLVHCVVLYVVVRTVHQHLSIASLDQYEYWSIAALAAMIAVLLSAITYKYVEHPFISLKRRAAKPALRGLQAGLRPEVPLQEKHG